MVYIFQAKRTPIGAFQGQFKDYQGWELGAQVIKTCAIEEPHEVIMGCVLGAGQGQAPTRQAVIKALNQDYIPTTTINKVCGSGMQAIMLSCDKIRLNPGYKMIAGGFESMTNAPHLLLNSRTGCKMGAFTAADHIMLDGLEDAYHQENDGKRRSMGMLADMAAAHYSFSRQEQEEFVLKTFENFIKANQSQAFDNERIVLTYEDKKGNSFTIENDEPPTKVKTEKFSQLKPAFGKNGTITAATSSSLADGAASLFLGDESLTKHYKPLAKIVGYASYAREPEWFTIAPIDAIHKLLHQLDWRINQVDLFEINEAFAVVPMAAMHELEIPREKINVHGGACVMGHPLGASGARIVVSLIHALRHHGLKRGIATACIGGGEATAIAIEIC